MTDASPARADGRLLVVDDETVDGQVLTRLLIQAGWSDESVTTTETGRAALDQSAGDPPDCILLDYRLADIDGLTFLSELSRIHGHSAPAVVIVTGQGSESTATEALKLGAHDYVVKTGLTAERLSQAIKDAISKCSAERDNRERLENLSTFVNAVVHDLKRPLTSMGLNVDLCKMSVEEKDSDGFASAFDGVSAAYAQMRDMLESLHRLVLNDNELFEGTVLDLSTLVKDAVAQFSPVINSEGIELIIHELPTIVSDQKLVTEVVQNIIENAISHGSTSNPVITIQAATDRRVATKPLVGLVIIDNGRGLDEKTLDNMFEPLWHTPSPKHALTTTRGNSGLGLAICEKLMNRLGGKIYADNSPDGGARFFLLFATFVETSIPEVNTLVEVNPMLNADKDTNNDPTY